MLRYKKAFTIAEVLLTLGIISIVAAMTLPTLISKYKEIQFKSAYKKAYSDFSQALQSGLINQEFNRTTNYEEIATIDELNLLKKNFKILTDCGNKDIGRCWKKGDTVCGGSCQTGNSSDGIDMDNGAPETSRSSCFVDISGRSWCSYSHKENIFLVDTNGFSNPNQFGKDRWLFTFADSGNNWVNQGKKYKKIIPFKNQDIITQTFFCKRPPCYYQSWLLK